eukprot:scaffold20634_cov195-Skeletonema_marinoi.AAC.1
MINHNFYYDYVCQVFELDKISAALEPRMQFNIRVWQYPSVNKGSKSTRKFELGTVYVRGQYNKVSNNNKQSNPILLHLQCIACIATSQS